MRVVSKLSCFVVALLLASVLVPEAQAGDGLFARLRRRACKSQCVQPSPCQQTCKTEYCESVKVCERFKDHPDIYNRCMCIAKTGYQDCLKGGGRSTTACSSCQTDSPSRTAAECEATYLQCTSSPRTCTREYIDCMSHVDPEHP